MAAMEQSLANITKLLVAKSNTDQLPVPGGGGGKKPHKKSYLASLGAASGYSAPKKEESKKPIEEPDTEPDDDEPSPPPTPAPTKKEGRERIADEVVEDVAPLGSFTMWVRLADWRAKRNRHEAEQWAYCIDEMRRDGVSTKTNYFEAAIRRLLGLFEVDEGSPWALAQALEWHQPIKLLPRSAHKEALKMAALMEKYKSGGGRTGDSDRSSGGGGGGHGGKKKNKKSHDKRRSGGASSGQGATGGAGDGAQKK